MTEEKFISNPYASRERMYRTGDIGRWLPDGNLEYLGRKDHQIKISGNRVETGEIENVLLKQENIESCAVIARDDAQGEKQLVAYYKSSIPLSITELRKFLISRLPKYMIPSLFVELATMPLTPNGKIDKKNLPDPTPLSLKTTTEYVAPSNELESELVDIWQEILGRDKIGLKDDFFALGGNSLKVIQIMSRINKKYNINLDFQGLFLEATIAYLAEQILFVRKQNEMKANTSQLFNIEL